MMKQGKRKIINIASVSGEIAGHFRAITNCASKEDLVGFTKSLAIEINEYGINVNAVCPGVIATAMTMGPAGILLIWRPLRISFL